MTKYAPRVCRLCPTSHRTGASFLEILGCIVALVVGVIIGANYLGVDLKGVAAGALKSAEVAAPEWLADAEHQPIAGLTNSVQTESPVGAETEIEASEVAATETAEAVEEAPPAEPVTLESARERKHDSLGYLIPLTPEQKAVLTRAYWDDLTAVIAEEEENRRTCIDDACNLQLFEYLTHRKNAHAKAAEAIRSLTEDGVDAHVLTYSKTVLNWHEEGEKLFGRAIDLLTDAPTAQLTGPFAQSWQSAATQHRMEEKLIVEKRTAVQTFLDHELVKVAIPVADPAN